MAQSINEIIEGLYSEDKAVILKNVWDLVSVFDSYAKIDKSESAMNRLIELCTLEQDRDVLEQFLDIIEIGAVSQCAELVDFEPLVKMFAQNEYPDMMWRLVIILGFSCQPKYIDYLNSIETTDSFLLKEIKDAITELEYVKSRINA